MKKATKAQTRFISAIAFMALPVMAFSQGYYDDDIYYNPAKDSKKKEAKAQPAKSYISIADYPAADTYTVNTGSTRDVDEYNRRGQFLVSDSVAPETDEDLDTYSNTRRIQRFHNEDIIQRLNDDDYATYVITDPVNVNVYVNDPWYSPFYPSYSSWRWRWGVYSPYWSWSWGIYDPWYWGPSWSWGPSWTWGPSWAWGPSWGWGPSYGPAWGPGWGPGHIHGPGWGGGIAMRPTGAGSSRPHAYVGGNGTTSNRNMRPVSSASANRVTGASSRPGTSASSSRPGSYRGTATGNTNDRYGTPAQSGSNNKAQQNVNGSARARNNSTGVSNSSGRSQQSTSTPSRSSSSSTRSSSSSSSGSYNRSGGSSSGSFGGGSHSSGGGRSGGGGGGARGRH